MNQLERLAYTLRALRVSKHMSVMEVARASGLTRARVLAVEGGSSALPISMYIAVGEIYETELRLSYRDEWVWMSGAKGEVEVDELDE